MNDELQNMNEDMERNNVETQNFASLQQSNLIRLPKSISSFIGGYKSAINAIIIDYIDKHNLNILKYNHNDNEYYRIKNYIINNPKKWNDDKFNPTNAENEL